ncbi:TPA: hypothetical protein QDZ75_003705 [Stenotrophomonas maltophilia]|nr:hypothetical protein [Stenotrophomonas maltophilia]
MSVLVEVGRVAVSSWNWNAISAVITGFAAFIALTVGVLPLFLANARRKRQAKVLAQVLADELSIQELHLRAAMQVPNAQDGRVTAWEYQQISKAIAFLNAQPVMDLISFSPNLPRYLVSAVAQCAAMLSIARQRIVFLADPKPGQSYTIAGDIGWYESVAADILKLRVALHRWIGSEPQEFAEDVRTLAENLRKVAITHQNDWRNAKAKEQYDKAVERMGQRNSAKS